MPHGDLILTVRSDKVFDDFVEVLSDVNELLGMIPEWSQLEAQPIVDKLSTIFQSWITIKQGE